MGFGVEARQSDEQKPRYKWLKLDLNVAVFWCVIWVMSRTSFLWASNMWLLHKNRLTTALDVSIRSKIYLCSTVSVNTSKIQHARKQGWIYCSCIMHANASIRHLALYPVLWDEVLIKVWIELVS
jgi:hypothetical protein